MALFALIILVSSASWWLGRQSTTPLRWWEDPTRLEKYKRHGVPTHTLFQDRGVWYIGWATLPMFDWDLHAGKSTSTISNREEVLEKLRLYGGSWCVYETPGGVRAFWTGPSLTMSEWQSLAIALKCDPAYITLSVANGL